MIRRKRRLSSSDKDGNDNEDLSINKTMSNCDKQSQKFQSKVKRSFDNVSNVGEGECMKKLTEAQTKNPESSTISKSPLTNSQSENLQPVNNTITVLSDDETNSPSKDQNDEISVSETSAIANLFSLVSGNEKTMFEKDPSGNSSTLDAFYIMSAAEELLKQQQKAITELVSTSPIAQQQVATVTTPQSIIKTIDQITKQADEILENLPKTSLDGIRDNVVVNASTISTLDFDEESLDEDIDLCDKLLESATDDMDPNIKEAIKVAIQPGSQITASDIANYLKLLGHDFLMSSLPTEDSSENEKDISTAQADIEEANETCEKILASNQLHSNIASILALRKRKSSSSESSDMTRVRIAESLLLLGELNKSKFCVGCKKSVQGDCLVHGDAMKSLKATKAVETLPNTMTIQKSTIPKSGLGVFSLVDVEIGTLLGPMEGEIFQEKPEKYHASSSFVWEVYENDQETVSHYMDCGNQEKSNWMRFINCARFEEEQNLIAEQHQKQIFFKTYKKIEPGDEFLVWYGSTCGSVSQSLLNMDADQQETSTTQESSDKEKANAKMKMDLLTDKLQCKTCKSMFSSEYYLTRHRTYACPETTKFHCEECDTVFKNMDNFRRHQRRGCSVEKTFKCIICSAEFTQKANLKVHLKTHFNIREFKCQYCGRFFSRNTFLKNHVLSVHEKEKPFVCPDCGKTFSRMDSMKRHASLHQERKAECSHCGMSYHTVNNLNMHIKRSHTNNTEMLQDKCRICSAVYPDIKSHMFFMHQKKAMAKCQVCNKYFRNMGNHMRSHEQKESKQQQCPVCGKYFLGLNRHMKTHENKTKAENLPEKIDENTDENDDKASGEVNKEKTETEKEQK